MAAFIQRLFAAKVQPQTAEKANSRPWQLLPRSAARHHPCMSSTSYFSADVSPSGCWEMEKVELWDCDRLWKGLRCITALSCKRLNAERHLGQIQDQRQGQGRGGEKEVCCYDVGHQTSEITVPVAIS